MSHTQHAVASRLRDSPLRRVIRRWLLGALGPVALFGLAALLVHLGGAMWSDFARLASPPYASRASLVDLLVLDTVAYRIGEEPGWRGLALPRLEVRHGPLTATLILTPLWALWHLRALFYRCRAGYQGGLPAIVGFVFALPVGAIVLTFLYDGTRGSVLLIIVVNVTMQVAAVISPPAVVAMSVLTALAALAITVHWIAGVAIPRRAAAREFTTGFTIIPRSSSPPN